MSDLFSVDKFINVLHLKKVLCRWRSVAILFLLIILALLPYVDIYNISFIKRVGGTTIARIHVSGVIDENHERDKLIDKIKEDNNIHGVIIHIDSPGGTFVGGETLYNSLRALSAKKHVVAVMGNVAASGAYMAAIAADYIIAHNGTITGSIGVLMQSFEITELANKIGINFRSLKAGEFKGSLSPFTKMSDQSNLLVQEMLDSGYNYFVSLVAKRRGMSVSEARTRADGKIYTGQQALLLSLIDQIGGEVEAINWLKSNNVSGNVKDFSLKENKLSLFKLLDIPKKSSLGLLALWNGYEMNE